LDKAKTRNKAFAPGKSEQLAAGRRFAPVPGRSLSRVKAVRPARFAALFCSPSFLFFCGEF